MIGNQLHQLAHDERNYVETVRAGVKPLSLVGTDCLFLRASMIRYSHVPSLLTWTSFSPLSLPSMPPLPSPQLRFPLL